MVMDQEDIIHEGKIDGLSENGLFARFVSQVGPVRARSVALFARSFSQVRARSKVASIGILFRVQRSCKVAGLVGSRKIAGPFAQGRSLYSQGLPSPVRARFTIC